MALVFIPGLSNTAAIYTRIKKELGDFDYHDISLVRPSVKNFDEMLRAVKLDLPIGPFNLVGFSMGGYVALALALDPLIPVNSLVLINTRAVDDDELEVAQRSRTIKLLSSPKVRFEGMTWGFYQTLVGKAHRNDRKLFEEVRSQALQVGAAATVAQLRANQTRPDMTSFLSKVSVKTLLISGSEDTLIPAQRGLELSAGIAGSELHVLKGCGHLGPLEQPAEIANLIKQFLYRRGDKFF